jgi:hypothetical protein
MAKKRGRPKRETPKKGQPQPCFECGCNGEYYTDTFGIVTGQWRCQSCHENACRSNTRNDYQVRYGVP